MAKVTCGECKSVHSEIQWRLHGLDCPHCGCEMSALSQDRIGLTKERLAELTLMPVDLAGKIKKPKKDK